MKSFCALLLFFAFVSPAFAQLTETPFPQKWTVGIGAAVGSDQQSGSFVQPCGCTFKGGIGTTTRILAATAYSISNLFRVGLGLGFDHEQTHSAANLTGPAVLQSDETADTINNIALRGDATFTRSTISLAPFVQFRPFDIGLFLQAGPSVSFLTGSHFLHTRTLTSSTVNGVPIRFESSGGSVETVEDQPIEDPNTVGFSAIAAIGWDIPIFGLTISPMATYELPLTTIRNENQSGWKISSFYGSLMIKFGFN